jgi:xanthine dehydrogenase accessory factor
MVSGEVEQALGKLIEEERPGARVVVVSESGRGSAAVVDANGVLLAGALPPSLAGVIIADAITLVEREMSRTLDYDGTEVYIESVVPPPVLVIFGAVHIAQELCALATRLGYSVVVSDARPAFLTRERFPEAARLALGWPDQVDIEFDSRTHVVILSHDARFEDPLWPRLLSSPVRYIGAMGSRNTASRRRRRLLESGYGEAAADRIHGPVGLDIGAVTPGEVALAILAELTRARYRAEEPLALIGAVRLLDK